MMKNRLRLPTTRLLIPVAAALVAAAMIPSAASADSIAYIKDGNVWLSSPDRTRTHQVTSDGSAVDPYRSPSQADDGTIAVSKGHEILFLEQNGTVLRRFDPIGISDSTSSPLDGVPVQIAVSPDGSKVAYQFATYSCPIGTSCGARTALGVTDAATGTTHPRNHHAPLYLGDPSWFSNGRLLAFDGYLHQVNTIDVGPGAGDVHWFDDEVTDLGDGEATRQGDKLALVRGYDTESTPGTHIVWYQLNGQLNGAQQPTPAQKPTPVCEVPIYPGNHDPTWSPDGSIMAWADVDGVYLIRNVTLDPTQCHTQAIEEFVLGASEPDFGPADVDPKPIVAAPPPGGPRQPGGRSFGVSIPAKAKLRKALKGLRLTASVPDRGTVTAKATLKRPLAKRLAVNPLVATGKAKAPKAGDVKVLLEFPKKVQQRLRKAKSLRLIVKVMFKPASGQTQSVMRAVTLTR